MKRVPRAESTAYEFVATEPKLVVRPQEVFALEVEDAFNHRITDVDDLPTHAVLGRDFKANPAAGPIFVEGAHAGDVLVVEIRDIIVDEVGIALIPQGQGPLRESTRYPDCGEPLTRIIKHVPGPSGTTSDGTGIFAEGVSWPLQPHIGVLGTAPKDPLRSTVDTESMRGKHGGNLDCRHFSRGSRVMLAVALDGAYLYAGDVHASQASEFGLTADETRAEILLSCDIVRQKEIPDVRVETSAAIIQVGGGPSLDLAIMNAHMSLLEWLTTDFGFTATDVYLHFAINPEIVIHVYRFSGVGEYEHTVGVSFPRRLLPSVEAS